MNINNIKYSFSNQISFLPWIGPNYENGINGVKTLVLGESLWCCEPYTCTNEFCKSQAIEIIKKQIEDKSINPKSESNPYYTKVSRLIFGEPFSRQRKIDFWNNVAFYELIQVSVGKSSRIRPTKKMWNDSETQLFEVLSIIQPDIIFVPGKQLSENFINKFETKLVYSDENYFFKVYSVKFNDKFIRIFSFKHPAGGLTYKIRPKIYEFINQTL